MAVLEIDYEFVKVVQNITFGRFPATVKNYITVSGDETTDSCRGIFYVVRLIPDAPTASSFVDTISLDKDRRARGARVPLRDGTGKTIGALEVPFFNAEPLGKGEAEKSIGVLKVVRPSKANEGSIEIGQSEVKIKQPPGRMTSFDVLVDSTEFLLEDIQEQMTEKFQVHETFGEPMVYFFGKRAEVFTYGGTLLNGSGTSGSLQWKNIFIRNYDKYLRGTKAVENRARVFLLYDDVVREGLLLSTALAMNSQYDNVAKFNFSMLVLNRRSLGVLPPEAGIKKISRVTQPDSVSNISEVRFVRGTARLAEFVGSASSVKKQVIPGFENPPDITEGAKRLMRNIANKALKKVSSDLSVIEDQTVFVDFIVEEEFPLDLVSVLRGRGIIGEDLIGEQVLSVLQSDPNAIDSFSYEAIKQLLQTMKEKPGTVDPQAINDALAMIEKIEQQTSRDAVAPGGITKEGLYQFPVSAQKTKFGTLSDEAQKIKSYVAGFDSAGLVDIVAKTPFSLFPVFAGNANKARAITALAAYAILGKTYTGVPFSAISGTGLSAGSSDGITVIEGADFGKVKQIVATNNFMAELETNITNSEPVITGSVFIANIASTVKPNFFSSAPVAPTDVPLLDQVYAALPAGVNIEKLRFLRALHLYVTAIVNELIAEAENLEATTWDMFIGFSIPDSPSFEKAGTNFFTTVKYDELVTNMQQGLDKLEYVLATEDSDPSLGPHGYANSSTDKSVRAGTYIAPDSTVVWVRLEIFVPYGIVPSTSGPAFSTVALPAQQRPDVKGGVFKSVPSTTPAVPGDTATKDRQRFGFMKPATAYLAGDGLVVQTDISAADIYNNWQASGKTFSCAVYKTLTRGKVHKALSHNFDNSTDLSVPGFSPKANPTWPQVVDATGATASDKKEMKEIRYWLNKSTQFKSRVYAGGNYLTYVEAGLTKIKEIFSRIKADVTSFYTATFPKFEQEVGKVIKGKPGPIEGKSAEVLSESLDISRYSTLPDVSTLNSILNNRFSIKSVKMTDFFQNLTRQVNWANLILDLKEKVKLLTTGLSQNADAALADLSEERLQRELCGPSNVGARDQTLTPQDTA